MLGQSRMAADYDCESSIEDRRSAHSDIACYVRRYANCISGAEATEDCSSEFRRLKNAQDEFECAVSDIELYCEF